MIMACGEEFIFRAVSSVSKGKLQNLKTNGANEDFQIVQAGFCMVVVQFWTGDAEAKQRAMTTRFVQVIEVRFGVNPAAQSVGIDLCPGSPLHRYVQGRASARRPY